MPTYDYKCDACGHTFEQFQSIKADPAKKCPSCGKLKLRRLIGTGAGLIFKGSGFYITDYRDAAYKDKAKADSAAGETKSDSKEAKPAAETSTTKSESPAPAAEAKAAKSEPAPPSKGSTSSPQADSTSSPQAGPGQASKTETRQKGSRKR